MSPILRYISVAYPCCYDIKKKLPLEHGFTGNLQSQERSLMKIKNSYCCGFCSHCGCGECFGYCDDRCNHCSRQIMRELDSVVFEATVCTCLATDCVGCDTWLKSNETLPLKCRQFRTLNAIFLD